LRLLERAAIALAVMVIGLILFSLGVKAGGWIALIGLVAALVIGFLAPWPGSKRWQEWSRRP
jgi:hypothetical protein